MQNRICAARCRVAAFPAGCPGDIRRGVDRPHRRRRQARDAGALRSAQCAGVPLHRSPDRQPVAGRRPRERGVPRRVAAGRGLRGQVARFRPGCSRSPATRRCPRCAAAPTSIWTTTWRRPSRTPPTTPRPWRTPRTATRIVQKCLTQLSPAHREVIDLVYYHEKSVDEVAQIVGVPAATVKTRMFYARNKMADLLKQSGVSAL